MSGEDWLLHRLMTPCLGQKVASLRKRTAFVFDKQKKKFKKDWETAAVQTVKKAAFVQVVNCTRVNCTPHAVIS